MGRKQASAAAAGALRAPALLYPCVEQSRTVAVNDEPKNKEKASRERQLGAALRENLKRRKAQARARGLAHTHPHALPSHDSAGIAGDDKEKEGQNT
jgi:hypothetical protein